jgi:hypothetical protein
MGVLKAQDLQQDVCRRCFWVFEVGWLEELLHLTGTAERLAKFQKMARHKACQTWSL